MNNSLLDDCSYNGCDYVVEAESIRRAPPQQKFTYENYDFVAWDIHHPVRIALGLTKKQMDLASFTDTYHYTDTIRCLQFEGAWFDYEFTDEQWLKCEEMQKIELTLMFTTATRRLFLSRMMRRPMKHMQTKVEAALGLASDDQLKFMVYSAHDDQVDNMMVWLNPNNYEMDFVLFASTVFFELSYSKACLAATPSEDCFHVDILYNGVKLDLNRCTGSTVSDTGCSYKDFKAYMASVWYTGPFQENLDLACSQTYTAGDNSNPDSLFNRFLTF